MHEDEIARKLGVCPSTLVRWERQWHEGKLGWSPRGRPVERMDREMRQAVYGVMQALGPEVGLPTLRRLFPEVARSELIELQRHGRRSWRRRRKWTVNALRWTRAGSVWAMDFSDPPAPIDGVYATLFCVRDLASGYQILGLPCPDKSASIVVALLESLARWYGAPLVLKCDNDGAFRSEEVKAWAERCDVLLLYSPPRMPEYNGSIEAGIGSIKPRAHYEAARHARPGEWTCDDVEAAVEQANQTARPQGRNGPTPKEAWIERIVIGEAERKAFRRAYRRRYAQECAARGLSWGQRLQHEEKASIDRAAISRTLVEHGFLLFRRKRISLPIRKQRAKKIS